MATTLLAGADNAASPGRPPAKPWGSVPDPVRALRALVLKLPHGLKGQGTPMTG
ncbi:hypothetical protein GCM10022284_74930 [Streptomyces hundungensis]